MTLNLSGSTVPYALVPNTISAGQISSGCPGTLQNGYCILSQSNAITYCNNNPNCTNIGVTTAQSWNAKYNNGAQSGSGNTFNSINGWNTYVKVSPEFCYNVNSINPTTGHITTNVALCDNTMNTYCATATGKSNPKCACINSTVSQPYCNDQACMNGGYMTASMSSLSDNCPQNQVLKAQVDALLTSMYNPTSSNYVAPTYSVTPPTPVKITTTPVSTAVVSPVVTPVPVKHSCTIL